MAEVAGAGAHDARQSDFADDHAGEQEEEGRGWAGQGWLAVPAIQGSPPAKVTPVLASLVARNLRAFFTLYAMRRFAGFPKF